MIKDGAGVFVRNVPLKWSESDIEAKFKQLGPVKDVQIKYERGGKSRGLATICYGNSQTA